MKILSMTATFGKLEHQTLTLQKGLNIIEAPNEWGKSTWCAFLVAMLYGIDTRERSKTGSLADKERYAPWSGSPMSGSLRILWQGRDITIERATRGRSLFGQFRAFETDTGLDVPELTADNCGQVLLGVEKSVFLRSGFLKLTDLPVTEDQALWRRLNALVTTGDESGASDALAQKLRDLKNRCRSNRTNGLIPQAQAQQADLENKLSQLQALQAQSSAIRTRQGQLEEHRETLQNHQRTLAYETAQESNRRITAAEEACQAAIRQAEMLEAECAALPELEEAQYALQKLKALQEEAYSLQMEQQMLPQPPAPPAAEPPFAGLTPEDAVAMSLEDGKQFALQTATRKSRTGILLMLGSLLGIAGIALLLLLTVAGGIACLALSVISFLLLYLHRRTTKKEMTALREKYGSDTPAQWEADARAYAAQQLAYAQAAAGFESSHTAYRSRQSALREKILAATGNDGLQASQEYYRQALAQRLALEDAQREVRKARAHAEALRAVAQPAEAPSVPDSLTFSALETDRLLSDCEAELRQLQRRLGHAQGQMESIGMAEPLQRELDAVRARLARLDDTYAALEIALNALQEASNQLRRRFAPRISKRAQEIFTQLTGNRYDRLILGSDMSLSVGAHDEDTLHGSLWRSDGTVDQLYLALRLAVAEELTPDAPLILDDALVRFDDGRLAAAMAVLQEAAAQKQVLLFTCQSREKQFQL